MNKTFNIISSHVLPAALVFALAASFFSGCAGEKTFKYSVSMLNTVCEITIVDKSQKRADKAIRDVYAEIERLQKKFNYFDKESELSKLNDAAGIAPVQVGEETFGLIEKALEIGDITHGAFDVTVGPLISLWKKYRGIKKLPPPGDITRLKRLVDYRKVRLDKKSLTVFLPEKGMRIDLGGIAKGYAAQRVAVQLKNNCIRNALVHLGGDMQLLGTSAGGQLWKIGVQHPRKQNEIVTVLKGRDESISTSGDYERFAIINGKRYHHIIDPKTGYPADKSISATIITDDSVMSDGLSTGIFVLGPEEGMRAVSKLRNTEAIIISQNEKGTRIVLSEEIKKQKLEFRY
jgi:FAD:protein FMN transferase